jgi:hypothetical protein
MPGCHRFPFFQYSRIMTAADDGLPPGVLYKLRRFWTATARHWALAAFDVSRAKAGGDEDRDRGATTPTGKSQHAPHEVDTQRRRVAEGTWLQPPAGPLRIADDERHAAPGELVPEFLRFGSVSGVLISIPWNITLS